MINIDYLLPDNKNYPTYPYGTGINTGTGTRYGII